jgi:hypothetical protein
MTVADSPRADAAVGLVVISGQRLPAARLARQLRTNCAIFAGHPRICTMQAPSPISRSARFAIVGVPVRSYDLARPVCMCSSAGPGEGVAG